MLKALVDEVNGLEAEAGEGAGEPTNEPPHAPAPESQRRTRVQTLKREDRLKVIDTLRGGGVPDADVRTSSRTASTPRRWRPST